MWFSEEEQKEIDNLRNEQPLFVVLEGPDGSGKTTLAKRIVEELGEDKAIYVKEPDFNCSPVSKMIGDILIQHSGVDKKTEALLFAANRNEHIKKVLIRELSKHKVVICDRYLLSSIVYQGMYNDYCIGEETVYQINEEAIKVNGYERYNITTNGKLIPHLTFVILPDPQTCLDRIKKRLYDRQLSHNKNNEQQCITRYDNLCTIEHIQLHKSFRALFDNTVIQKELHNTKYVNRYTRKMFCITETDLETNVKNIVNKIKENQRQLKSW